MNKSQFETSIQKWVALDNQIRNINERTKQLRDEKNHLEETILQHIETNKLNNAVVNKLNNDHFLLESHRNLKEKYFF